MLVHNVLYGCQNGSNKPFPNLSHYWLSLSKVNLNSKNSGPILLFKTMQQLAKGDISSITVGKSVVNTKPVVRNLVSSGLIVSLVYSLLILASSIAQPSVIYTRSHQSHAYSQVLKPPGTKTLVHAFATSHVD